VYNEHLVRQRDGKYGDGSLNLYNQGILAIIAVFIAHTLFLFYMSRAQINNLENNWYNPSWGYDQRTSAGSPSKPC
jgi:hypothetical protein